MKRYQKQSIKLMWLVNLGLLFVFGYALKIFLTSNQREEPSTGQEIAHSANSNTGNVALSAQSDVNSTLILERNIFGKGGRAKPEVQKIPVENKHKAVESAMAQLGIKLLGTVAGDQAVSFAVLKDSKTDKQDIYQEGDTIQGARLEKILANRVVVVFHGERLVLNVASTEGRAMSSRPTVTRAAKPPVPVSMQGRIKDVLMAASPSEFLVNRIASGNSVQRLAQGLRDLTLEANREGPAGLKVTGVAKSPVARMIGLRDGDVIRRINGLSVGSLTEAGQVLRNARNAGIADIKLTRGQKEKTLSLRPSIW
jgi:type II secretion system protein C